jgi:hypothetical protein
MGFNCPWGSVRILGFASVNDATATTRTVRELPSLTPGVRPCFDSCVLTSRRPSTIRCANEFLVDIPTSVGPVYAAYGPPSVAPDLSCQRFDTVRGPFFRSTLHWMYERELIERRNSPWRLTGLERSQCGRGEIHLPSRRVGIHP